jgi:nitrilase
MVSGDDLESNLASAERLIARAAEQGARLVVLPENFALFSSQLQLEQGLNEAFGAKVIRKFLSQQAKKHRIWLVGGTLPLAPDVAAKQVWSSCFVVDDTGAERVRYDKVHLFDVDVSDGQGAYRESGTFKPGDNVVTVDTPLGRLGVAVCYDLRFPELFRQLFSAGAELVALPSAFTRATGNAHWLPLLRARAIENQCYMLGANQGGQHSAKRATSGGSVIIDSWGKVLAEAAYGEACVIADIDRDELLRQRQAMPIVEHRRLS